MHNTPVKRSNNKYHTENVQLSLLLLRLPLTIVTKKENASATENESVKYCIIIKIHCNYS